MPRPTRGVCVEKPSVLWATLAESGGSLRAALDAALSSPSGRGVILTPEGRVAGTVRAAEVLRAIEVERGASGEVAGELGALPSGVDRRTRAAAYGLGGNPAGDRPADRDPPGVARGAASRRSRRSRGSRTGLLYTIPSLALFVLMPLLLMKNPTPSMSSWR